MFLTARSTLPPPSLCAALRLQTEMDSAYFLETLAGSFMDVVQYNQDNRQFEVGTAVAQGGGGGAINVHSKLG